MEQSQPQKTAPIYSFTYHSFKPENVEQYKKQLVVNKLQNPKMVSDKTFNNLMKSKQSIDKSTVYNYENCSIYEKELPDELFISILGYLANNEILKLERVSKNFKYYWLENRYLLNGRLLDHEFNEIFMYFKPIMETPGKTILNYFHFLHTIFHNFKQVDESNKISMVYRIALDSNYKATIGAEFYSKSYESNNFFTETRIWDTSVKNDFNYYPSNLTFVFSFDLSDATSFEKMKDCMESDCNLGRKPTHMNWNTYLFAN